MPYAAKKPRPLTFVAYCENACVFYVIKHSFAPGLCTRYGKKHSLLTSGSKVFSQRFCSKPNLRRRANQ